MAKQLETTIGDDYLAALGRIVANYATLESLVTSFIVRIVNDDPQIGLIVTAELSMRGAMDMLSSIVRYKVKDDQIISQFDDMLRKVAQVTEKRNSMIHSSWGYASDIDKATRYKRTAKRKQGFKTQFENYTVKEIEQVASEIAEANSLVYTARAKAGMWIIKNSNAVKPA